jgi:8-oxo-dGTP pyrophosphatase MutT (NUDIX family)
MNWSIESTRRVIRDRWLSVRADRCRMPDGREVDPYYVLEYPDWVNVVAVTESEEVVLVRQYRHGVARVVLELPSGVVEGSDAGPLETARRELLEETGYTSDAFRLTGVLSANPATHNNLTHCFLASACRKVAEPRLDDIEELEVVVVPLDRLGGLAREGALLQSLHVGSIFFALAELGRLQFR